MPLPRREPSTARIGTLDLAAVIATPVFQGLAVTVISLFLIQLGRRVTAQTQNPIGAGLHDGLTFLISG